MFRWLQSYLSITGAHLILNMEILALRHRNFDAAVVSGLRLGSLHGRHAHSEMLTSHVFLEDPNCPS
jgi:hypothetical protein